MKGWVLAAALLAACAPMRVRPEVEPRAAQLPRPARVLVYDFATARDEIHPDQEILRQAANRVLLAPGMAGDVDPAVPGILADALVARLRALGFPAERATRHARVHRYDVQVVGVFVDAHQSHRLGRLTIGFGVDPSRLDTEVDVLQASGRGRWRLAQFATGVTSDEDPPDAKALAFRSADDTAHALARVFTREGWQDASLAH